MGSRSGRWRAVLTVVVTVGVVCAELVLLWSLYRLDDRAQEQRLASARVDGVVSQLQPGRANDSDRSAALTAAVDQLRDTDAPGAAGVAAASARWTTSGSAADLGGLVEAQERTSDVVEADLSRADRDVLVVLAVLLAVVSVGWFLWFRRVVRRHREVVRRFTEQELIGAGERRLLALVHNSADVVAVLDPDSTIDFITPAVESVLGRTAESVTGQRLVDLVVAEDRLVVAQHLGSRRPGDHPITVRGQHADGRSLVLEGTITNLLDDPAVGGFVLTVRDVTERSQLQDELAHQAFHDSLTGLANRQLFTDRLAHALRPRESDLVRTLHLLFLDLDDFKEVNDSLGHSVGDELLQVVAQRIGGVLRPGDTAARLGGDEFAILLEETELCAATAMAERVLASLHAPVVLGRTAHQVRASVGVAAAVPGQTAEEEAMRNADVAMYMAKERGKRSVAVYDPAWHQRSLEVLDLRNDLQWAIDADELVLHYQPTIDLEEQRVSGFEALVRWQHPERGLLPPGDFIPVAEQSGLIVPLGRWVLREACSAASRLRQVTPTLTMSVNVSMQQLADDGFVDDVVAAFTDAGLPPTALTLEMTESALLDDVGARLESLRRLRRLGVRVAIDDFGTGYSSLSQLSRLPVDVLKVDKSFVDELVGTESGDTLVRAILAMSSSLSLTSIAEGVEDEYQARWLRQSACLEAQGFWWSPPVAFDDALALAAADDLPQASEQPVLRALDGGRAVDVAG